jgi:hypothetical protein
MLEVVGDLWTYPAEVRIITTNGFVKQNGEAVMGRGCALEAKGIYPGIAKRLGDMLLKKGNHVHVLWSADFDGKPEALISFPVKRIWNEEADLTLIRRSAEELVAVAANYKHTTRFVMPRPGCGNGRLKWEDVKPLIEDVLDERFHVITFK